MDKNTISRRDFLKTALLSFGAGVLAGCKRVLGPVRNVITPPGGTLSKPDTPVPTATRKPPSVTPTETQSPVPSQTPTPSPSPTVTATATPQSDLEIQIQIMYGSSLYDCTLTLQGGESVLGLGGECLMPDGSLVVPHSTIAGSPLNYRINLPDGWSVVDGPNVWKKTTGETYVLCGAPFFTGPGDYMCVWGIVGPDGEEYQVEIPVHISQYTPPTEKPKEKGGGDNCNPWHPGCPWPTPDLGGD